MSVLLDTKLNRVTTVVDEMKRNLRLESNASIEEVSAATDLKNLLNVFVQEEEPETKDGVWLQTAPFEFDSFTIDELFHIKDEVEQETKWPKPVTSGMTYIPLGDYVYGFSTNTSAMTIYKAPKATLEFEKYDTLAGYLQAPALYNNEFYLVNHKTLAMYKWNPLDKTFTTLDLTLPVPVDYNMGYIVSAVSTHYLCYFTPSDGWRLDMDTMQWTQMKYPMNYLFAGRTAQKNYPTWQGLIVVPCFATGSSYSNYTPKLYNPETNTWSSTPKNFCTAWCTAVCVVGNTLYMSEYGSRFKKVDLLTGVSTDIKPLFVQTVDSSCWVNIDEKPFIFMGNKATYNIATDTSVYPDNTLVILQGKYSSTNYKTGLFSLSNAYVGRLEWSFTNIYPYINGELLTTIPSYYGDGEKWIKFKN